jgi:hypothetical protein
MAVPYLKVSPEEAYTILDDCVVKGYQTVEAIESSYHSQKATINGEIIDSLRKISHRWLDDSLERLKNVFTSKRELFNFQYAKTDGLSRIGVNMDYDVIYKNLRARIDVLNEYINYIVHSFNIQITAGRDANVQLGNGNEMEVKS